jgi:DNA-binding NtrC family response regulator
VRELRNVIERAVIFAEGEKIDRHDIVLVELKEKSSLSATNPMTFSAEGKSLAEIEKNLIQNAIDNANGNQTKAARKLGLTLDTLRYRIKKYDLQKSRQSENSL